MKLLTYLLLLIAGIAGLFSTLILISLAWPVSGFVVAILVLAKATRRGVAQLTTLGSARWATTRELIRAKMLGGDSGLIIGQIKRPFFGVQLIRLSQAVHTLVVSPTSGGKGVSGVIPHLQTCPDPCVVIDPKGENARITAEHRRKRFGHRIVLLDPHRIVTDKPDTFNPLDFIQKNDRMAMDDCNDLADALVVTTGKESDRHWDDSARVNISAMAATVVAYGDKEKGTRSIQTVREFLNHPEKSEAAIRLMTESDMWDGMLAQQGGHLRHFADREKASIASVSARHMAFLGTPTIADSTRTSSFDPAELRRGKMTIYLIVPPDRMHANAGLLRMWISALLRACVRGGLE